MSHKNHKKNLLIPLVFIAVLLLAASTSPAEEVKDYVSVKNDSINVRSAPSTKAEIHWEVFSGFPLRILKKEKDWVQTVDFEGDKGWVFGSLLSDRKTVIVKVDTANMRSGPGQGYDIIARAKKQVIFTPIDKEGNWIKVSYKNGMIVGWIYNTLLWPDRF